MEGVSTSDLWSLLDGTPDEVPTASAKIVRVFLSSTFSDMAEERNMLMKDIYPKIQDYAKTKYAVNFQMVDMRWGVTNEAQNDHMTSTCCLKEIRNCQQISVGPNFVVLIGQKYGYRPIPAFIDSVEFQSIRTQLVTLNKDLSVLDVWYLRDENAVPPQYVLQPINSILRNYDNSNDDLKRQSRDAWQETFDEIRQLLMEGATLACDKGLIGKQTKGKYFNSVTQEEIELGLSQSPAELNKRCICFIREIEDLYDNIHHSKAQKFIDMLPTKNDHAPEIDTDAQNRLAALRDNFLVQKLNEKNVVRLKTKWSSNGAMRSEDNNEYLQKMTEVFYEKMVWLIDENLADKGMQEDTLTKEIRQSLQIRNKWSRIFFGRTDILASVEAYLKDNTNTAPFALYGESGTGKTAVIAKCAKETKSWMPKAKPVIICRFLGTTPHSSHILLTLIGLCTQICDVYEIDRSDIPNEYKGIVPYFQHLLKKISLQKRLLVIYLDSLDQLSTSFEPYTFQWLPKILPVNVKVVVSMVPTVFNLLKRFKSHVVNSMSNMKHIPPLGDVLCMDIVRYRLKDAGRTITFSQSQIVQELFQNCSLPLFSRILLEEILTWKSYTYVTPNMVSSSMKDTLNNFFKRLEMQHGNDLVKHTLAYITASKEGVSEMELLDLLSLDDDVLNSVFVFWLPPVRRLPPFLWTRLRLDLNVFLVTRDAGDVEVFTWYHRLFKETAAERYIGEEGTRIKIHLNLAEYFAGVWSENKKSFNYSEFVKARLALTSNNGEEDRKVSKQPLMFVESKIEPIFNKRKLSELPYHLVQSKQYEKLSNECIFNYNWLWSKISAYGLQMVLEDLELALSVLDDVEIRALTDTLRIAGCTLNDYPENLALEITGRLLDYLDTMPKIQLLIQQCDQHAYAHSAIITPFQLYEIPQSALTKSIEFSPSDVGAVLLINHDSRIITLCIDGTVQAWDAKNGSLINEVNVPHLKAVAYKNLGLYTSKDEKFVICESRPSAAHVAILNAETLEVVTVYKIFNSHWNHKLVLGQKYMCMDNAVFQINTGKKVLDMNRYRKIESFVALAFTVCDKYLLIGGDKFVDVFKVHKGERVKQLPVTSSVSVIKMTSHRRFAIIGTTVDCVIKIFDIDDQSKLFGYELVTYDPKSWFAKEVMTADSYATTEVSEICISNKEDVFVSLIRRKFPIVWGLRNVSANPKLLRLAKGTSRLRYLFQVQFSADDRFILAAELSPNVMIWDSCTGDMLATFQPHENDIHDLVLGVRTSIAITVQQNSPIIKIWNLQKVLTMHQMSSVKLQQFSVKNLSFSNQSNIVIMSRTQPPVSSKAYHFIDYFGVDILDLATGKLGSLLPFDRYGHVQSMTNSLDASIVAICTGTQQASTVSVLDVPNKKLLKTWSLPVCKSVKLSKNGNYLCVFVAGNEVAAHLFTVPKFELLEKYKGCKSGMFTKKNAFIGVAHSQLFIRLSMDENDRLTIDFHGDVTAIHYSDVKDLLLVTVIDENQPTVTVLKTESFGTLGTIHDVSMDGISDVADNGSIFIDTELQIFDLDRCKRVKQLLSNKEQSDASSVRLSSKGEHAIFISRSPTNCVKVCRIRDGQVIARAFLHCVPEILEVVPSMNVVVVIGKEKKLFVLALRDMERKYIFYSRYERLAEILGVQSTLDVTKFEMPVKVREELKMNTKTLQIKHINLKGSSDNLTNDHSCGGKGATLRSPHHGHTGTRMRRPSIRSCSIV